ncbi:MAG: Fe(3+) ABC transporter substrate-binding protein [Proteobacteria bacterium]|nr:Fe(3+) ABC transporter substrate-binding protein [Pseudomonadota bacterium]
MKNLLIIVLLLFQQQLFAAEVNVYSARKEALIKPLFDQFTEQTGIDVNLVTGKADTLIKRLEVEDKNSPADILITVDAARLIRGKEKGLFQAVNSSILEETIPAHYRDSNKEWFGLSLRSRVIVYAPDRVTDDELDSYIDLADENWKNRICVRSSSNVYNQSLVAAMISNYGIEKTRRWADGLVSNFARPPKGGDRDQIKAVAAGICDVALVNNYYLAGMLESSRDDEVTAAKKVKLFWPNQDGRGAHMNISGAALLKSAKHKNEAVKLLEFLVSDAAQQWYADTNHEYSINPKIKSNSILKNWGDFKSDTLNLNLLGKHNADAVILMDQVGWK